MKYKITLNKKELGFNPEKITKVEKADIFDDRIEITFELEE